MEPRIADRGAFFLAALLLTIGCGGTAEAPPAEPPAPTVSYDVYQLRGEIVEIPQDVDRSVIVVRHEAIDDFRGPGGEIVGMDSMTMRFPLVEGIAIEDLKPADKIEMTYEVAADGSMDHRVTALRRLPVETELRFDKATPHGAGGH